MTNTTCSICGKSTRPGDEPPLGPDTDCGGDCAECVAKCDPDLAERLKEAELQ